MRSNGRMQILLLGLTVLALAAGVAAGVLASRAVASPGTETSPTTAPTVIDRTPLVQELGLSPEQRDRMREIWEGVRGQVHDTFADAQRLQRQRDDALVALLTDEQKAQFEKISKDYANQFADLTKKRDKVFEQAVERTKALLNDEQRRRYDEILKSAVGHPATPGLPPPALPSADQQPSTPTTAEGK